jgi:hypothetical protein
MVLNGAKHKSRILIEFEDPETYNLLDFSCSQYGVDAQQNRLYYVGCDLTGAKDIWFIYREIGDISVWNPHSEIWSQPFTLAYGAEEITDPFLITGPGNLIHAFWSSTGEVATAIVGDSSIYYARWYDEAWSRPVRVLTSLEGNAREPDVTLDQSGRLFVAWSGGDSGEVQMSWSSAQHAYRTSEWTLPRKLPAPVPTGGSPDIFATEPSKLYLVYAIPLNEYRGIYLISSEDGGNTWSEPREIFSAVQYAWDMVNEPKLTVSEDGTIHVLFTRFSLPGGQGRLSLHYTRSLDDGTTWSEPERVAEQYLYWSRIIRGKDDLTHRIWQGVDTISNRPIIYHQYSQDEGVSWSSPEIISPQQLLGSVDLDVDSAGRLHLVMSVTHSTGEIGLEHWSWSGNGWSVDKGLMLDEGENIAVVHLSASITPSGHLGVLYSGTILSESNNLLGGVGSEVGGKYFVAYAGRDLDIIATILAPPPVIPSISTPTTESAILPTPELNPTTEVPVVSLEQLQERPRPSADNTWMGLIFGAGLAVVLVAVAFGINAKKMGRR